MHQIASGALHESDDTHARLRNTSGWRGPVLAFLRAHVIAIAICLALVLAYALAGFFLVPYIARTQLESFVTQTLKQRVTLGELRFNPFTFETSAHELRISEPSGRELVGLRHMYVDAELASVWQRAVVLNEVEVAAPSIKLVVERDGSVNLTKLKPPAAADDASNSDEPPTPVRIGRFTLREGRIGVEDHARPRPFVATIEPIRFVLSDFKTDAGHRNGYQFSGTTARAERLDWNGEFTVQPLGSTGRFRVGGFRLNTLGTYTEESLPFKLSGDADLSGSYRFELEPLALDVTLPQLAIRDLALAEKSAESSTPIRASDVQIRELAFSLDRQDVHVNEVDVRGARIDVAREADGSVSLMRLFAPQSAVAVDAPPAQEPASDSTWRAAIETVRLEDATVVAEDRSVQPAARFELSALNASIAQWHNGADAEMKVTVDTAINAKARLAANGTMRLDPLRTAVNVDLSDFDLATVQPYVAQTAKMTVHSGALNVKGDVRFEATEPNIAAAFRGDVRVADLRTTDDALNQDFIKWRTLAITGIAYEHQPASLSIERIAASQPYGHVIIAEDGTVNVSKVLNSAPAADAPAPEAKEVAKPATSPAPMPISVKLIQIDGGSANFADRSIQPSFAAKIVDLQGTVTGLSSKPSSRAKVSLNGKVDEYAPVDINGEVNVLAAAKYSDLAMNFRNMELTTFNPYSGKFAGYNISKGKLSTELKYRVEDRRLKADHHIVVDNLEFGDKTDSKDAAPIPIKLGVALLKDRNGVIDINLPVAGTLDDPKFRLGPIIWKAVLGLLTKIVTAPFAALGELFGGGDELAYVEFAPGSAELNPAQTEKLGKLSKAFAERPALRLDVPITVSTNEDAAALAKAALAMRIPPEAVVDAAADDATQRKQLTALEKTYRSLASQLPAYPEQLAGKEVAPALKSEFIEQAMLASLQPDASALDTLARERARAVQTALLTNTEVNAERVFITTERKAAATPEGSVRMELKLE